MKLIQFFYTLSYIFGCWCCPFWYDREDPEVGPSPEARNDPNLIPKAEVIRIPEQQKIAGAMSRKDGYQERDNEEHEVFYESQFIKGVSPNFDIDHKRDVDEDYATFNLIPKVKLQDWAEYADEMQKVHAFEREIFAGALDNEKRQIAKQNLAALRAKISDQFDIEIRAYPFNYLVDPLALEWVESDARPQLDQATLLHDPRLIPHMLPLMQTMSDAIPALQWGKITEERYREILDEHFRRFCLKTELGYGMVHIIENGKAYMLQNPQISDEGYDEVVLNGVPTKLKGSKVSGERISDVMFMKGEGDAEVNKMVTKYHASLEKRYTYNIYDLVTKYDALFEKSYITDHLDKDHKPVKKALISIDLEKQLEDNPELLAQMLFVLIQIGRENIGYTGRAIDISELKIWLMRMLPSFSEDVCWGTLIQLCKHQDQDRNAIRRQFLEIKDLNGNPRIPFMLPFRFAVESEGIFRNIAHEVICYID